MKALTIIILFLLWGVPSFAQTIAQSKQEKSVVGTRVSLIPPSGFTPSERFPGYSQESTGSSIMVTEFSAPLAETSSGLTSPSALAKRGMVLLKKQQVVVDGQAGILAQVKQNFQEAEYLKWLLLFGDGKESVLITAAFPKELESQLSEAMKASILTARLDSKKNVSPLEGLNFFITEKGGLRLAKRMANLLLYTRNGIFPSKDLNDPIFVVGQSLRDVGIGDAEAFVKARVRQTAEVTDVEIERSNKVTIDNLEGYEIVAKAKDKQSGLPMVIYQVILFEGQGYYLMHGMVSSQNGQSSLVVFKEMSRSFTRRKSISSDIKRSTKSHEPTRNVVSVI
jgi:hypothetical protein